MAPSSPPIIAPFELYALEPCPDQATAKEVDDPSELLLDAQLTDRAVGSRVVQLFEPPFTPGALQARIEWHLGEASRQSAGRVPTARGHAQDIPDASDALHAALNEIRQSLRGH